MLGDLHCFLEHTRRPIQSRSPYHGTAANGEGSADFHLKAIYLYLTIGLYRVKYYADMNGKLNVNVCRIR